MWMRAGDESQRPSYNHGVLLKLRQLNLPRQGCYVSWKATHPVSAGGRLSQKFRRVRRLSRKTLVPVGQNTPSPRQPLPTKIFHFTEFRKYRTPCPSRLILRGDRVVVLIASRACGGRGSVGRERCGQGG